MATKQTITLSLLGLVALVVFYLAPSPSIEISPDTESLIPIDSATPINTITQSKTKTPTTPMLASSDNFFELWLDAISESKNPEDLALASIHVSKGDRAKGEQLLLNAYSRAPNNLVVNLQIMQSCLLDDKLSICSLPYIDTLLTLAPTNGYIHLAHANNLYKNGDLDGALAALVASSESAQVDSYYWKYLEVIDDSFSRLNVDRTISSILSIFGYAAGIHNSIYTTLSDICSSSTRNNFSEWSESCYKGANNLALKSRTILNQMNAQVLVFRYSNLNSEELKADKERRQIQFKERSDSLNELSMKLGKLLPTGSEAHISDESWSKLISLWKAEGEWVALTYWHDAVALQAIENGAYVQ